MEAGKVDGKKRPVLVLLGNEPTRIGLMLMASDTEAADLESLINEYEDGTDTTDTTDTTPNADLAKFAKAVKPAVDFVKKQEAKEAQAEFDIDVKGMVSFFGEAGELKGISDKLMMGFIEAHAAETPDFKTAFENRAKNPKAWETARETARDAVAQEFATLPGSKVRTDVEAAKAAVDGTTDIIPSHEGPTPVQLMRMSDQEWRGYKEQQEELAEARLNQ